MITDLTTGSFKDSIHANKLRCIVPGGTSREASDGRPVYAITVDSDGGCPDMTALHGW